MKKLELGQAISILANVGVIAGIVFLAIEIDQGNQLARSQTRSELSGSIAALVRDLASDPELSEIYLLKSQDPDSLSELEEGRLSLYWVALFRTWENMHYQYRNGLFEEEEFEAEREVWRIEAQGIYFQRFFCQVRQQFSATFVREVANLMPPDVCSADD